MNAQTLKVAGAIVLAIVVFVLWNATFIVHQTEQALVLRFGGVRSVATEPGLYFKLPMIENVVEIDNRVLDLDLPEQEVIAADQKRLVVDAFARYRVTDPVRFYQTVNNIAGANLRLANIINSTVRSVVAEASFTDIVRTNRSGLMREIQEEVNRQAQGLGLTVIDVQLRRADLPQQNSEAVYQRMQTERQREAADIRAQGSQLAQTIRARADRDVTVIRADANQQAQEIRGQGDAQVNTILGDAYSLDSDFFAFFRSLQAYTNSLGGGTRWVLSPDSHFFRFLDPAAQGRAPQPAPQAAPAPAINTQD
ncbi:protease modulator HflC [Pseudochelatococcus contaminans]|uniref:Protein HflC n=1 Tax=Pseudochelatococcus contaminans TaxID=1538103 RepID=A0A7W5Z217_9HYPH|nr:protease modulator HflC [Pseudochelatococcus contaminans]MBB3808529.1 membrane protease subunit HflC [Pseudochelatococcus contaminans]